MDQNFNCRKLYLARVDKKMSRRQLGKLIGVGESTIRGYEEGKIQPKLGRIKELASAVGINPEELFCFKESKNNDFDDKFVITFNNRLHEMQAEFLEIENLSHRSVLKIVQKFFI